MILAHQDHVQLMQHVPTNQNHTPALVSLATLEMDIHALEIQLIPMNVLLDIHALEIQLIPMNVLLDPINVHLMPRAEIQLVHIPVPVTMVLLEVEELVMTRMNVEMDLINVHLTLHALITLAHMSVSATLASLEMEEPVHA